MIPARLLNRSLSWVQPGVVLDGYGDETADYTAPAATFTTITARVEQVSTTETVDETRDLASAVLVLYTNETGIASTDLVTDGSIVYEVAGLPAIIEGPRGAHHAEVRLRRSQFVIASLIPGGSGGGSLLTGDRPVWFGAALPTTPDWVAPFLWFNTTTETLSAVLADAVTGYSDIYSDVYA